MSGESASFRPPTRPFRRAAAAATTRFLRLALPALAAGIPVLTLPHLARGQPSDGADDAVVVGVVASVHGTPMADVAVRFLEADYTMVTSEDGAFHAARLSPGRHTVQLRYMGLASRRLSLAVTPGDVIELDFQVEVDPMRIEELQVEASGTLHDEPMAGFWRRKLWGAGAFLDPPTLAGAGETPVTGLLRHVQGVTVERCELPPGADVFARSLTDGRRPAGGALPRAGGGDDEARGDRGRGQGGSRTDTEGIARPAVDLPVEDRDLVHRPGCQAVWLRAEGERCRPGVFVEGRLAVATGADPAALHDLLSGLRARELVGVEVYRTAAETPPLFQRRGDDCGAVALWLRGEGAAEE